MFSGCVTSPDAVDNAGWHVAAAADIVHEPWNDILNPDFFALGFGPVFEQEMFALAHSVPQCSSFSASSGLFCGVMRNAHSLEGRPSVPHDQHNFWNCLVLARCESRTRSDQSETHLAD